MAWSYANWESAGETDAERLSLLREHLSEVRQAIENWATSLNSDSKGRTKESLNQYLATLMDERDRLEGRVGRAHAGGRSVVRFRRMN